MNPRAGENRRDRGLDHLGRATRWVTAGAIVLVGVLSAVVAKTLPGRSVSTGQTGGTVAPQTSGPASQATDPSTGAPGLQAPQQAPSPVQVPTPPPVLSGGS